MCCAMIVRWHDVLLVSIGRASRYPNSMSIFHTTLTTNRCYAGSYRSKSCPDCGPVRRERGSKALKSNRAVKFQATLYPSAMDSVSSLLPTYQLSPSPVSSSFQGDRKGRKPQKSTPTPLHFTPRTRPSNRHAIATPSPSPSHPTFQSQSFPHRFVRLNCPPHLIPSRSVSRFSGARGRASSLGSLVPSACGLTFTGLVDQAF